MAWTTPGTATAGSVLTASFLNTNVRDNTNALYASIQRLAYQTVTANYTASSTTVAGASNVFSTGATWTAAAATAYRVEVYFPVVETSSTAGAYIIVNLVDGSGNDLGKIGAVESGNGQVTGAPLHAVYYYTPGAGSITLNVRAYRVTGTGVIYAGAGGAATYMPGFIAVFGPPMA